MYLADIYTVTANLAGIPGISVPCGENHERLPIGLQLFARHFDEGTLLRVRMRLRERRWSLVVSRSRLVVRCSSFAVRARIGCLRSAILPWISG